MIARRYRLREEGDVRRVRSRGRAVAHGPLVLRYMPNTLEPVQNRYTVIAGKRCGKAVQRNRLKRLVREAIRGYHPHLEPGHDIVLICRGTVEEMPDLTAAQETLQAIFSRAKLLPRDHDAPRPGDAVTAGWNAPDTPEEPA